MDITKTTKTLFFSPCVSQKGWKAIKSWQVITPDHPEWLHNTSQMRTSKEQYYDLGFTKSDPGLKSGTGTD